MGPKGLVCAPRGLVVLIAATTVVPLCALLWLGWRLVAQDRDLEAQQARARVESAGDLAVAALQRAISASEQQLAAGLDAWPVDAVSMTFDADGVHTATPSRLAYVPVPPVLPEPPRERFQAGEQFEYVAKDRTAAIGAYRALARSTDAAIRAGALLRLARNLAPVDIPGALQAYSQVSDIDGVAEQGVPVSLLGRFARCSLFESTRDLAAVRAEATRLADELERGRWVLEGSVYSLYAADAARWLGGRRPAPDRRELFAEAVAALWAEWQSGASPLRGAKGRRSLDVRGQTLAVLWQSGAGRTRALVADRRFAETVWLGALASLADLHGVAIAVTTPNGDALMRVPATPVAEAGTGWTATRASSQSELPWNLQVSGRHGTDSRFATRRRTLIAGLALVVFMALVASYLIVRAVTREMAVARLQAGFVAAVSHEFRTPLTSLRQFTDMLRDRPGLDEERRRVCYEAQARATERLTRLVESVLDLGRMEAGARVYTFEPRDCTALVRHVVEEFRVQPEATGFDVQFRGNGAATVQGDHETLSRAVWNLLDNAAKYSLDERRIDVAVDRRDESVAITVRDHGIGIPPNERAALFTRFRRGEQAVARGIKGTGIGLAMAHEIVRAHNGRIDVQSDRGAGSTFTIVLPAER